MTENTKYNADLSLPFKGTRGIYSLHLADNALILAQRNSEWCAHGPVLEQDIAITNISLDLLGQARNFYQHAVSIYDTFSPEGKKSFEAYLPKLWKQYDRELQEDDLAFLRDHCQYLNLTLCELPNGDWAQTILRQFFFSTYQQLLFTQLQQSTDEQLAAIAEKSLKEVIYHVRWSSEWIIRLGDGTMESKKRMQRALEELSPYINEMFKPADYEMIDVSTFESEWAQKVERVFTEATLQFSIAEEQTFFGKHGNHTPDLSALLSDMQFLQRNYPNASW